MISNTLLYVNTKNYMSYILPYPRLVSDYNVRKGTNSALFGTQGRLTFYFATALYIITLFSFLFSLIFSTGLSTDWDTPGALCSIYPKVHVSDVHSVVN